MKQIKKRELPQTLGKEQYHQIKFQKVNKDYVVRIILKSSKIFSNKIFITEVF